MRRIFACAAGLLLAAFFVGGADAAPARAVGTSAKSAILTDAASGRVLYEQNATERRAIASITKLMTALVAAEACPPETRITVSPAHTRAIGSSMYLRAGECLTLEELLYGLLLVSGNDAALAVAEGCAGDTERFVSAMNRRAASLGMRDTQFQNPSGLDEEGHYSTARDMAVLAAAVLDNELLARIWSTQSITIGTRRLVNHNKLLWRCDGVIGGKTGYTSGAGRTLVSAAERNGQRLVAVTLHDGNDWSDHAALYAYGYSAYPNAVLCTAGEAVTQLSLKNGVIPCVPLHARETVRYPLAEGERAQQLLLVPPFGKAPVRAGEAAGSAVWMLNGTVVGETELVWGQDAEKAPGLLDRLRARLLS